MSTRKFEFHEVNGILDGDTAVIIAQVREQCHVDFSNFLGGSEDLQHLRHKVFVLSIRMSFREPTNLLVDCENIETSFALKNAKNSALSSSSPELFEVGGAFVLSAMGTNEFAENGVTQSVQIKALVVAEKFRRFGFDAMLIRKACLEAAKMPHTQNIHFVVSKARQNISRTLGKLPFQHVELTNRPGVILYFRPISTLFQRFSAVLRNEATSSCAEISPVQSPQQQQQQQQREAPRSHRPAEPLYLHSPPHTSTPCPHPRPPFPSRGVTRAVQSRSASDPSMRGRRLFHDDPLPTSRPSEHTHPNGLAGTSHVTPTPLEIIPMLPLSSPSPSPSPSPPIPRSEVPRTREDVHGSLAPCKKRVASQLAVESSTQANTTDDASRRTRCCLRWTEDASLSAVCEGALHQKLLQKLIVCNRLPLCHRLSLTAEQVKAALHRHKTVLVVEASPQSTGFAGLRCLRTGDFLLLSTLSRPGPVDGHGSTPTASNLHSPSKPPANESDTVSGQVEGSLGDVGSCLVRVLLSQRYCDWSQVETEFGRRNLLLIHHHPQTASAETIRGTVHLSSDPTRFSTGELDIVAFKLLESNILRSFFPR